MPTTNSSTWPKNEREGWGVLVLLETLRYLLNLSFIYSSIIIQRSVMASDPSCRPVSSSSCKRE